MKPEAVMTSPMEKVLLTGGCGFIGSGVARFIASLNGSAILNIDCLTYAGRRESIRLGKESNNYQHLQLDIRDGEAVSQAITNYEPAVIMHLAAESHVDRSIDGPADFISTNVVGTFELLQAATEYWNQLSGSRKDAFRFHHISTDEVYGSLGETGYFTEETPYDPRSPYSASKASSDHLVRAWHHTYGLPTIITNCSNNYGPYQFPEKLIPLVTLNALERKPLPIYGKGDNIRDWLYVEDHVQALWTVVNEGQPGSTYNIGGNEERTNLQVVETICNILDETKPHPDGSYSNLIEFVEDRPGHDKRYAIDATKIKTELGWEPTVSFETGIRKTIQWYLENEWWWEPIRSGSYAGDRLGKVVT